MVQKSTTEAPKILANLIKQRKPGFAPQIGFILGSGLAGIGDQLQDLTVIPYADLPGFGISTVEGHRGALLLGKLAELPIVCLQGRTHLYEGVSNDILQTQVRTLKLLGCHTLFSTSAAGSLRSEVTPGNLMLIKDHINFQFINSLVGWNDPAFGPRFVSLDNAYDANLRSVLVELAASLEIPLAEGVYLGTLGPSFETPAEIHAFKILGADCVGMSVIPEVIIARHCGMKVAAVTVITNMAAGMSKEILSHQATLTVANQSADRLFHLIYRFIERVRDGDR